VAHFGKLEGNGYVCLYRGIIFFCAVCGEARGYVYGDHGKVGVVYKFNPSEGLSLYGWFKACAKEGIHHKVKVFKIHLS